MICSILVIPGNFIREGLSTWMPSILTEQFGQSDRLSLILTMALSVTALLGTYLAVGCNKFIKDYRSLLLLFFGCMALFIGGAILAMRGGHTILLVIFSGCAICLGSAINTVLITMLPLAMRDEVNSGFLATDQQRSLRRRCGKHLRHGLDCRQDRRMEPGLPRALYPDCGFGYPVDRQSVFRESAEQNRCLTNKIKKAWMFSSKPFLSFIFL